MVQCTCCMYESSCIACLCMAGCYNPSLVPFPVLCFFPFLLFHFPRRIVVPQTPPTSLSPAGWSYRYKNDAFTNDTLPARRSSSSSASASATVDLRASVDQRRFEIRARKVTAQRLDLVGGLQVPAEDVEALLDPGEFLVDDIEYASLFKALFPRTAKTQH